MNYFPTFSSTFYEDSILCVVNCGRPPYIYTVLVSRITWLE